MVKIERVDPDLVMCNDDEAGVGFCFALTKFEVNKLQKSLGLTPEQCEKLYNAMLEFRIVYLKEGKLFWEKAGIPPVKFDYSGMGKEEEGPDAEFKRGADMVEDLDKVCDMFMGQ